jgi:hypothetical protein
LVRNSDEVLEAFLVLTGHDLVFTAKRLVGARDKLAELLELINSLTGEAVGPARAGNDAPWP